MEEDSEFVVVSQVSDLKLHGHAPMAVSLTYPVLAVANSADDLTVYNIQTKQCAQMRRKSISLGVTVMCAAVSRDFTYVATGGMTDMSGEIVIWSLASGSDIAVLQLPEGVAQVQFGSNSSEVVYAEISGKVGVAVLSNFFIKWQLKQKARFERDLGTPIMCMSLYKDALYVGSQGGTYELDMSREGIAGSMFDECQTLCFTFFEQSTGKLLIARGVGHDVILTEKGAAARAETIQFSQTPVQVAVVDPGTIVVLFNGAVEMASSKHRCTKKVPKGLPLVHDGVLYIVADTLYEVKIVSLSQRIEFYVANENWEMVFDQLTSPDDVDNLYGILNRYINSESFLSSVLFDVLERLNMTDFVVLGMFTSKREEILTDFVDSGRGNWILSLDFVKEVIATVKDDAKLCEFLKTIELNLSWLGPIAVICLERQLFDLVSFLAMKYRQDFLIQYLIAFYRNDSKVIHATAHPLLLDIRTNGRLFEDTMEFCENYDLSAMVRFDEKHARLLFEAILKHLTEIRRPADALINKIIMAIHRESPIWLFISTFMVNNKMKLAPSAVPYVENFLFHRKTDAGASQSQLLLMLLKTKQFTDLQKYLVLARVKAYAECEYEIICMMHNVDELASFLITHKISQFRERLQRVVGDKETLKSTLVEKSKVFLSLNADEYCEELWSLGDLAIIHEVGNLLASDAARQWHFYKHVFSYQEFAEDATADEIITYVKYLCKYKPQEVMQTLRTFKKTPTAKVLSICQRHGIIDATLYMCDLMQDFDRAKTFCVESLTNALMENQDELVVTQVCQYLSTTVCAEGKDELWLAVMESFQLPMFAFRDEPEKVAVIADLLNQFMDAMIRDIDSAVVVAKKFTKLFSFLPFKTARPILARFFHSVQEKYEFSGTLAQIMKYEVVQKQMTRIRDMASGHVYDAVRCPICNRLLGQGNAVAAQCGHVFHQECARNGWCPHCQITYNGAVEAAVEQRSEEPIPLWPAKPKVSKGPLRPAAPPQIGRITML